MTVRWVTDTVAIPVIDGELDATREIPAPWLRPAVSRYETPGARLDRRWRSVRTSRFAADLAAGWGRARAWLGVAGALFAFFVVIRGAWYAAMLAGLAR